MFHGARDDTVCKTGRATGGIYQWQGQRVVEVLRLEGCESLFVTMEGRKYYADLPFC